MNHATRWGWTAAVLIVLMGCSVVLSLWLAGLAVQRNDARWCDTLTLLTSKPVAQPTNPAKDQSRENQYRFYIDLVKLRSDFGCR